MLECVINISEGRRLDIVTSVAHAAGTSLLDVHTDPDHHRAVLTVVGGQAARAVAEAAVETIDLRIHDGAHPRIGAVDVVPFVALAPTPVSEARRARDDFAAWAGTELGVPCFLYGPERTLPEVRRHAWRGLSPDTGPATPHPSAGAMAVGMRPPLVAYNLWLETPDLALARNLARHLRGPAVRALGLAVGAHVQVSMNLVDPLVVGPAAVYDEVARHTRIARAELVGLVPAAVLDRVDQDRWTELDLSPDRTIEARCSFRSLRPWS